MPQNARVAAFTVSELIREKQQGGGVKLIPCPRLGLTSFDDLPFTMAFPALLAWNISGESLPNCTIVDSWVFNNFVLHGEPLAKSLRGLKTCVAVTTNLWGELVSSLELPITFGEISNVILARLFIPDFSSWSCEFENFKLNILSHFILILY